MEKIEVCLKCGKEIHPQSAWCENCETDRNDHWSMSKSTKSNPEVNKMKFKGYMTRKEFKQTYPDSVMNVISENIDSMLVEANNGDLVGILTPEAR